MAKTKTAFFCGNCGAQYPKWMGHCTACDAWNTIVEEVVQIKKDVSGKSIPVKAAARISDIEQHAIERIDTGNGELNRVLGGGIVPGSMILLGGEPGIGKSTLLLQIAIQKKGLKALYVSGEESAQQIRMRAERIGISNEETYVVNETDTLAVFAHADAIKPDIIIIDSIQTMQTPLIDASAGTISQIRESAADLQRYSKQSGIPVFIIGHITKDGHIAGPKILEHIVDTVLQFEGDRHYGYRILRTLKNRFGSTFELGIFEMLDSGMREVTNPSEILISNRDSTFAGIAVAASLEGIRPLLIEIQALVSNSPYGNPQRSATGFDLRRMNMLLAVLEKRGGFRLGVKDVFLNITGGIKVDDPSVDLAVVAAIISSFEDVPLRKNTCLAAEVGLSGEVRPVSRIEQRIAEAEKLGFERIIVSRHQHKEKSKSKNNGIIIEQIGRIEELFSGLFG